MRPIFKWMNGSARVLVPAMTIWSWSSCCAYGQDVASTSALVEEAEHWFYAFSVPDHIDRVESVLDRLEQIGSNEPYLHWARGRCAFWRKEELYLLETPETRNQYTRRKLELAGDCHRHADECVRLAPKNPECYLVKGACYSMQASTWGAKLKSLRIAKPMDLAWEKAMELPSDFHHPDGYTTRQYAAVFRGALHRILPDSFWFRFFAGIRGNKERAYRWAKEGVVGIVAKEPAGILELAATTICYGIDKKKPAKVQEGLELLTTGESLPSRYGLDDLDKQNMKRLTDHYEQACGYRREQFEDLARAKFDDDDAATDEERKPKTD
ncbi:MAG TPA: hypothetical protein VI895_03295 [Bdellovibrionota bacterium]|nr:hypothetical protein [Bdellovibrionota bacterium]